MIVVTGCGRSGTKWAALALQHLGLDVQHERMGENGISSWCMARAARGHTADPYPTWHEQLGGSRLSLATWVHLVRHPLYCIASLMTVSSRSLDWAEQYYDAPDPVDEPRLRRCMRYWVEWNALAEQVCSVRMRLEGLSVPGVDAANRRTHGSVTWSELAGWPEPAACGFMGQVETAPLALEVMRTAKRYGYDVPLFDVGGHGENCGCQLCWNRYGGDG